MPKPGHKMLELTLMSQKKDVVTVVTHDGFFHADEVFALAVLKMVFEKEEKEMEVVRTRDLDEISKADVVVDVGGVYDFAKMRFDHHQKEKPGNHDNGLPYASFGLIWKHFGGRLVDSEIAGVIEQKLVTPIDALDNGINLSTPIYEGVCEYTNAHIVSAIGRAYPEGELDKAFEKALEFVCLILRGEINKVEEKIVGMRTTEGEIKKQKNPEILVLEKYVAWESAVTKHKNVKLVIFPDKFSTNWCIQTAREDLEKFDNDRVKFPKEWRGLTNQNLTTASGIEGSVFCHVGGFFAINKSKEGAKAMAEKTLLKS